MIKNLIILTLLTLSINTFGQKVDTTKKNENLVISKEAKQIEKLTSDVSNLQTQLDTYNKLLNGALIVFTVLMALGSGFSIFSLLKNEYRESKAFKIAMESYQDSKGESSSVKQRENSHFEESHKTLTLVNETLTLATEATKRASKSLENRLIENLNKLEKVSSKLIQDSLAFIDDKNLTTDTDTCSEIHRIGRKIEGLENNLIILEDNQITLKPYCNFVRATDSYLSEQFDQALDYIDNVIFSSDAENNLKSLAYFWKGYIQNNLGLFSKATQDFKNAYDLAVDSRKYELRRIELETKFFNKENTQSILQEFESLTNLINNDNSSESQNIIQSRKAKIKTTVGNIYYQLACETQTQSEKLEYFRKSLNIFAELLNVDLSNIDELLNSIKNNPDKEKLKWTIFGLAEALYQSSEDKVKAIEIFQEIVYYSAENEFLNREEKRTKVLAKTTQLICDIRSKQSDTKISQTKAQVESALSSVDKRLTLYSQIQRRNVSRQTFRNDLNQILKNV